MKKQWLFTLTFMILLSLGIPGFSASLSQQAPNFRLPTLDNQTIDLADYRGQVVYLDFWATWCAPCRRSFPWMESMHNKYNEVGLKIIAISLDQKPELIRDFLSAHKASFTVVQDKEGESTETYKVRGMPTSYLIDKKGDIRLTHQGFSEGDKYILDAQIKKLLAE